jgi:hypothetical protein
MPPFSIFKVPFAPTFIDAVTTIAFSSTAVEESLVVDDPPLEDDPLLADELSVIELAIELYSVELAVASPPGTLIATIVGIALMACGLTPDCGGAKVDCSSVVAVSATCTRAFELVVVGAGLIVPVSPIGSVIL